MKAGSTTHFASAARRLASEAHRLGLAAPGFRSPPRIVGFDRTVRHRHSGGLVAVALLGRPFVAVLSDMIEGVIVINKLQSPEADRVRTALWTMLSDSGQLNPQTQVATLGRLGHETRVA